MPFIGAKQLGAKPTIAGATAKRYTYDWSPAPILIGRYQPCVAQALPTIIDMTADPTAVIPFYSSGAARFQYRVKLTYDKDGQVNQEATFTPGQDTSSSVPTIENDIDTDSFVLQPDIRTRNGMRMVTLGDDSNGGFGMRCVVKVGAGGDGQLAFCQLVKSKRTMTNAAGVDRTRGTNGQWWLDGQFPYSNEQTAYAPVTSNDADGKEVFTDDSPGEALLNTDVGVVVEDEFQMHIMYRLGDDNDQDHSIWVSLGYLMWGWTASATRASTSDTWVLVNLPGVNSAYKSPFVPGNGCPIQQGRLQLADAARLRGRETPHRK